MTPAADLDCLVIADDLTGACDAGAQFAARGMPAAVLLSDEAAADGRVIAVSTDSRDLAAAEIRASLRAVSNRIGGRLVRLVFAKIDSTLRGNPRCLIAAAMEQFEYHAAVVCPAFPALGRIVRDGALQIAGSPEFEPIRLSSRISSVHIAPDHLAMAIRRGARTVSLDAESDADLDHITAAALALDGPLLWAGSAGLAAALARALGGKPIASSPPPRTGPVLFCIGSDHPVTLAQEKAFASARNVNRSMLSQDYLDIPAALANGSHVWLCVDRCLDAAGLRRAIGPATPAALVLSGGDTASMVCRALSVKAIDLCDEPLPGIPRGMLRGGSFDGIPVVTKSGGFGTPDALIRIADYFSCPNS